MHWLNRISKWLWNLLKALGPIRLLGGILLTALLAADLYCEVYGLPADALDAVRAQLFNAGFRADIRDLRAGLLYGVRADGITLWDGQHPGVKMADIRHLRLNFSLPSLLRGNLRLTAVEAVAVELHAPSLTRDPARHAFPSLALLRFDLLLRLSDDGSVDIPAINGNLGGIRLNGGGRIHSFPNTGAWDASRFSAGRFGWDSLLGDQRDVVLRQCQQLLDTIAAKGIPRSDGFADIRFDLPVAKPEDGSAWGTVALSDVQIQDVELRRLRGKFAWQNRHLKVQELLLQVIGDQTATVDMDLDLEHRILQGKATGILEPQLAFRLLGRVAPRALTELKLGAPLKFKAELLPSPLADPGKFNGSVLCTGDEVWYHDFGIGHLEGQVSFNAGTIALDQLLMQNLSWNKTAIHQLRASITGSRAQIAARNVDISFDQQGKERITGTLTYFPETNDAAANLTGSLLPTTLAKLIPGLPPGLAAAAAELTFTDTPPAFQCNVDRSPLSPGAAAGNLNLQLSHCKYRDLAVTSANLQLKLQKGQLTTTINVTPQSNGKEQIQGEFNLDLASQTIRGTLAANLWPDRLYKALRLPENYCVSQFVAYGPPIALTATLNPSPLDPTRWSGTGKLVIAKARYETLDVTTATANVTFAPDSILFSDIRATTTKDEELKGDCRVSLPNGDVLVHGDVHADPIFAEVFVGLGHFRERFRQIWAPFTWNPKDPPRIHITKLEYINNVGTKPWHFTLQAHVDAENMNYKTFHLDSVRTDMNMELPQRLDFLNTTINVGQASAQGQVTMELEDMASCKFKFQAKSDPRQIVRMINADWDNYFTDARFSDDSDVACEGAFFFGQESRTRLQGSLKSGPGAYQKINFTEFSGRWQLDGSRLSWAPATAQIHGGSFATSGTFDFDAQAGNITLAAEKIDLANLAASIGTVKGKKTDGKISGNCRLDLLRSAQTAPLQINGGGRVWITQGDLWNMPFLNTLGDLIGMTSLGKITRLDATLDFAGDHLQVSEFHTDGSILALHGQGNYFWNDRQVDFSVRGDALKTTQIVPMLLKPLFWFFEAELTGDLADARWRLAHSSRKPDEN